MNQIRIGSFQNRPDHFNHVRIVVFGTSWISCTAQIVMNLGYRNAVVFSRYCFVIGRNDRRRLVMSNHMHAMPGTLRAHGQAMRENFRAADVTRKILMCQINDSQNGYARSSGLLKQPTIARGKKGLSPLARILTTFTRANPLGIESLRGLTCSINSR